MQSNGSMSSRLAALALLIVCPRCQTDAWSCQGDDTVGALVCHSCHTAYPWHDGVLDLGNVNEDPNVAEERVAVRRTERNAALGGINDEFEDLSRAEGALKEAILALPYGNNSRYYAEPGYFSNVRSAAPAFDFLLEHLELRTGDRLLDLGADLTWSTHQMARRGLDCCAVDINHHLSVGRLFEAHSGVFYHRVRANMRDVPFRAGIFGVILAMNALHHADRIEPVAANIARMLKRGGRLAFVEPYCATEEAKAAFGRAQIEAGISEQTYLLHQWHPHSSTLACACTSCGSAIPSVRSMRRLTARIAICSPDSTTVDFQFSTRPLRLRRRPSSGWSLRSRIAATPYGAQSASSLSMRATILAAGAPTVTCLSPSTICARASRRRSDRGSA